MKHFTLFLAVSVVPVCLLGVCYSGLRIFTARNAISGIEGACCHALFFDPNGFACSRGIRRRRKTLFGGTIQQSQNKAGPALTDEPAPPLGCLPEFRTLKLDRSKRTAADLELSTVQARYREEESMPVAGAFQVESRLSADSAPKADLKVLLLLVVALTAVYVLFIAAAMQRHLWYDELFTLDIARAPTSGRVIELIRKWDLNPPLSYFLSRWSMQLFGPGELGLRLPSILEFYAASLFLFASARRRIGNAFTLFAILILWEGPEFYYAVEARPYALLLMFFSMLFFCWDRAISTNRPAWSVVGTFFATLGMLLSHVFAPLSLSAILAAEGVRFARTRKADPWLWIALLLPCIAMLTYIPLFKIYRPVIFPYREQASLGQIRLFFQLAVWDSTAVAYASMFAFVASRKKQEMNRLVSIPSELLTVGCFLLFTPILLNLVLMHGHRTFWPRYCITAAVATCVIYAFLLAYRSGVGSTGGYVATVVVLLFGLFNIIHEKMRPAQAPDASILNTLQPELPLVVENGLTFFEMNQFESRNFLARTYYLKNRAAAIQYSHGTLFEDFEPPDRLDPEFHIQAHVDEYGSFIARHPRFVMLTSGNGAYWLVQKLRADGERIEKIADVNIPYRDSELYLVTIRKPETDSYDRMTYR